MTTPETLNYAPPRANKSWIWITLATITNLAVLLALASLWLPNPVRYSIDGPAIQTFGYLGYAKISSEISNGVYRADGPIFEWDRILWHPAALTTTLLLTLPLLTLILSSIPFTLRRIRSSR